MREHLYITYDYTVEELQKALNFSSQGIMVDYYCAIQSIISAKLVMDIHYFESKCDTCPLKENKGCRFIRIVR